MTVIRFHRINPDAMHLIHFAPRYPPALGGSEAYVERLTRFFEANGDSVDIWTTTAIDLEAFWKNGKRETPPGPHRYRPLRFPLRRYVMKALSFVPSRWWQCATMPASPLCPKMWRDAGRYEGPIDAVHAFAFPYAFPIVCAWRLAKRRGVPFLLTPFLHLGDRGDRHDRTWKQYTSGPLRWLLKQADTVFVQTNLEADAAAACGVERTKIMLQGLGVDPVECTGGDRIRARHSWGVDEKTVVVGHLSNNSVEKGTVDLLNAWPGSSTQVDGSKTVGCKLVLAGPSMPNFESRFHEFENKQDVIRLGVLSDAEKRNFFAGIDIFCLPSRSDSFGLVLLEAWANRKPVVVYDAGGPSELVRHEIDGLISECNPNALQMSLGKLLKSPEIREQLGSAGEQKVRTHYSWERSLKIVSHHLRSVVHQSLAPATGEGDR